MQITKDTIISDVLTFDKDLSKCFLEFGMRCLGCSAARGETIAEACEAHSIDVNELLAKLNAAIKE